MINLASPRVVHDLLNKYHLAPNKRFGQNFLVDATILEKISLSATINESPVLEIGPGLGSLTQHLATKASKVVAVEIDRGFIPVLQETLVDFSNVAIINADFLKVNLFDIMQAFDNQPFVVCANLPYYITTPILLRLLESGLPWTSMCFLLQKEVGERFSAQPRTKHYGSLSLVVQYYADVKTCFKVSPNCFVPTPAVDSSVVQFTPKQSSLNLQEERKIFAIIRASFSMRRKTLANNLIASFPSLSREYLQNSLQSISFSPQARAEELSLDDFIALSKLIDL